MDQKKCVLRCKQLSTDLGCAGWDGISAYTIGEKKRRGGEEMINLITVACLQTCLTLAIVYLRLLSVNRVVSKPPEGYKDAILKVLRKSGRESGGNEATSSNNKLGFRWWKVGAVRRQLILHSNRDVSRYGNEGGKTLETTIVENKEDILRSFSEKGVETENKRTIWGFFHPYCNAGGGGEKVLWKAVECVLQRNAQNVVVVYTGDNDTSGSAILESVTRKFGYRLDTQRILFVYLKYRHLVDSRTWPHFTLLGQALGSVILSIEAVFKCPPDVWCDTMGYPFGYPWVAHLLRIPVVAYIHYPVISTDMLGKHKKSEPKYWYWRLFMAYYRHVCRYVKVAITNSTWTNNHMKSILSGGPPHPRVVYPPCSTEKLCNMGDGDHDCVPFHARKRQAVVLAQFRPEKRHSLILREFARSLEHDDSLKLIFIGSIRTQRDRDYVSSLRELSYDTLGIPRSKFEIMTDLPFEEVQRVLRESQFGINAMWNEHFGIAVVEYMACGAIPVVHASAGPLMDIVVDESAGFFFLDESDPDIASKGEILKEYGSLCDVFGKLCRLDPEVGDKISRSNIKTALEKFSDAKFDESWNKYVIEVVEGKCEG